MRREAGEYILKRDDPAEIGRVGLSGSVVHHGQIHLPLLLRKDWEEAAAAAC